MRGYDLSDLTDDQRRDAVLVISLLHPETTWYEMHLYNLAPEGGVGRYRPAEVWRNVLVDDDGRLALHWYATMFVFPTQNGMLSVCTGPYISEEDRYRVEQEQQVGPDEIMLGEVGGGRIKFAKVPFDSLGLGKIQAPYNDETVAEARRTLALRQAQEAASKFGDFTVTEERGRCG